jgi:hypothetical protein
MLPLGRNVLYHGVVASDEKLNRLGRTVGLLHFALRCARQGGMPATAATELNELVAQLFGESLELEQLQQKPSSVRRLDTQKYFAIIECALDFLCSGKSPRGLAARIKRKLRISLSEKQINRVLDEWMPKVLKELQQK